MTREFQDDISAMRYGMEQGLQDLKWTEINDLLVQPGHTVYLSPGNSVRFTMPTEGTRWAFAYDNTETYPTVTYKTFAEGDTWKEFERALVLARAVEEEKLGLRQDLIGQWWDSFPFWECLRAEWFAKRGLHIPASVYSRDAWRALVGHERDTIEREVLKGVTK